MNTKEYILEVTQQGLLFYKHLIPNLEWAVKGERFKNVLNPFYSDRNPSLSIYLDKGVWKFKDHGDDTFSGDVFEFAGHYFDLNTDNEFPKILEEMADMDYSTVIATPTEALENLKEIEPWFELKRRPNDKFKKHELKYFEQYGISEKVLRLYNVIPIDGFKSVNKNGKHFSQTKSKNDIMVAYMFHDSAKVYRPKAKPKSEFKFLWLGQKSENYIFGEEQLSSNLFEDYEHSNIAIITGGEKDVLTLASMGIPAICLNSETAFMTNEDYKDFYFEYQTSLHSLYDFDKTGRNATNKLKDVGIYPIEIPKNFRPKGKDISDFVKNGLTVEELKECIKSSIVPEKAVNTKDESIQSDLEWGLLPSLLEDVVKPFEKEEERWLVLLSSLAVCGGVFQEVKGFYATNLEGCNLYLFVIAPPASGKGVMTFSRKLGLEVHRFLRNLTAENGKSQSLYLPANNSYSGLVAQLETNNSFGVIFETEADVISDSLAKHWSNYSTLLRQGFHGEHAALHRKTDDEHVEMEKVYLSMIISGTPNQVPRLFNNTQNGLFSRFSFLHFNAPLHWDDKLHLRNKSINLEEHFEDLSHRLYQLFVNQNKSRSSFNLSLEQWVVFHEHFGGVFSQAIETHGADISSSVKRLGVITFKIAMILSVLRQEESDSLPPNLSCTNEDLMNSLLISKKLISSCMEVYSSMNKSQNLTRFRNENVGIYLNDLPRTFKRAAAMEVAQNLSIPKKTAEGYLKKFIEDGLIKRVKHNHYEKV